MTLIDLPPTPRYVTGLSAKAGESGSSGLFFKIPLGLGRGLPDDPTRGLPDPIRGLPDPIRGLPDPGADGGLGLALCKSLVTAKV